MHDGVLRRLFLPLEMFMPDSFLLRRFVDGLRVFEWQDGTITRALKQGSWILFDEINLAPADVLQAITPLLQRCGA